MKEDPKTLARTTVKKHLKFADKVIREFREFISRGSVVDLAVGVVIGGAFGKIVTSLVNDIIMPLIGVLLGGLNFAALTIKVGAAQINYGSFIQNIVNFLIIAASIFIFVKIINGLNRKPTATQDKTVVKKEDEQITLLKEIRDELRTDRKSGK